MVRGDKGERGFSGDKGERGDRGERGDSGKRGVIGDRGERGPRGNETRAELKRAERRLFLIVMVPTILLAGVLAAYVVDSLRPDPFDPLRSPVPQIVKSRVPGVRGPAVRVGDPLRVTGQKCSTSEEPVIIRGQYAWSRVDIRGAVVSVAAGGNIRKLGCQKFDFENPMPPEVVRLAREADGVTVWQIVGRDTPKGPNAVAEPYYSQTFKVVP